MSAKEGMYASIAVGAGSIALLTGVELSWNQDRKPFYPNGSLIPASILNGITKWEGSFKRAYTNNAFLGTFNMGTWTGIGTIYARGGTNPYLAGTMYFTSGNLSNMNMENINAVDETHNFVMYNVTLQE